MLNRGEVVNALKRAIYTGRVGPAQARRADEMQAVADALIEAERRVRNGTEPAPVAAAAVWDRYTGRDDRAGHPVR